MVGFEEIMRHKPQRGNPDRSRDNPHRVGAENLNSPGAYRLVERWPVNAIRNGEHGFRPSGWQRSKFTLHHFLLTFQYTFRNFLPELGAVGATILPEGGGERNAFECRAKGRDGINGQEKGKTARFSPNAINDESGRHDRPENYALFGFMAFSTSMLLFSPLEYLAMLMAIPAIWARA
ncbi:MAG: hypothetical protein H8D67_25675 [Deltaproteobacteria bacterium]|nr:hypothetical protein [Deltaproteobacteria bacterium]